MDLKTNLVNQTLDLMSLESRFHDRAWLNFTKTAILTCAPTEFFTQPASMSGEHHQDYELGLGGLVRHTIAAMEVARTLFPICEFTEKQEDSVIAALALHDIAKPSKTHPIEAKLVLEPVSNFDLFDTVVSLIETHHGQWDMFGKMPRPKSELQRFVHLCDYLASRKNIAVDIYYRREET